MNDYTKKIFKKDGALVAKEKQESQLRNANILGAANLVVNAKTLQSLQELNKTQQELVAVNQELLAINQGVLDELTKQTNILEKQEMERQIEKYDKDVQNQLKDVVFNVNQDVEKILNTSSGIAESYFRSRALISALNSYNVSSSSFSEINDKVFWSNLEDKLNNITSEANKSDDKKLKEFITALDKLYKIENFESNDNDSIVKSIAECEEEINGINEFLDIYKDDVSIRKRLADCVNDDDFHPNVQKEIGDLIWPDNALYGWSNIKPSIEQGTAFAISGAVLAFIVLVFAISEFMVLAIIFGIPCLWFIFLGYNWWEVNRFPEEWKLTFESKLKSLQNQLDNLKEKSSKVEFDLLEYNKELKESTKEVASFSKHYPFLSEIF